LAPDAWYENVTSKYYANEGGIKKDNTLVDFNITLELGDWNE
jgi:hypothetical protein